MEVGLSRPADVVLRTLAQTHGLSGLVTWVNPKTGLMPGLAHFMTKIHFFL